MKDYIVRRVKDEAAHIIETKDTVRATAKAFGVSKSTVFKDMSYRLPMINSNKAKKVHKVLAFNKSARYRRGGLAAQRKIKRRKNQKNVEPIS